MQKSAEQQKKSIEEVPGMKAAVLYNHKTPLKGEELDLEKPGDGEAPGKSEATRSVLVINA
jgi:hypothetical protein